MFAAYSEVGMLTEKEKEEVEYYGCTKEERNKVQRRHKKDNWWDTPYGNFVRQRQNARQRDIPWNLKFAEWWEIWELSGKWPKRGRGLGKYCMARLFDCGAYEVGNVHIIPSEENNRQWAYTLSSGVRRSDNTASHMKPEDWERIRALEARLP